MKVFLVPFSKGGFERTAGAEKGPEAILHASGNIYLSESGKPFSLVPIKIPVSESSWSQTGKNINHAVTDAITDTVAGAAAGAVNGAVKSADNFFFLLGGDHSVTFHSFAAFASCNYDAGLVILDAHVDCMEGTETVTHEDFVRRLVEQKIVPSDRIVFFGTRNMHAQELSFIRQHKIKYFDMRRIIELGIEQATDALMESVRQFPKLYLSIDIDFIDPAFAPGTGYIEPGGFSSMEAIHLCKRLSNLKNLAAVDIVELNPAKDINGMTSAVAAKLLAAFC